MNTFGIDFGRAVISVKFLTGVLAEYLILVYAGFESELFYAAFPVLASFPYSTAWLYDYRSGYIKPYLLRCGRGFYITGKFLACGLSGGLLPLLGCAAYLRTAKDAPDISLSLIFMSGFIWAALAAVMAAASNSVYIAYGGSFVIYYIMVIIHDRYYEPLYCLYPYEWIAPKHEWVLGNEGIIILLGGIAVILYFIYYEILGRCIRSV